MPTKLPSKPNDSNQLLASIIIVHYRAWQALNKCLQSLSKLDNSKFEIIVVDNDLEKPIQEKIKTNFPGVRYYQSESNAGFGAGCNLGSRLAKAEYLFFLNPDTKILNPSNQIQALVDFLESRPNSIIAPTLLDKSGQAYAKQGTAELNLINAIMSLTVMARIWPNNPWQKQYWLTNIDRSKPYHVGVMPGSAFMLTKANFEAISGFDENIFLYYEESDLAKRLSEIGVQAYIHPDAQVTHYWGKSTRSLSQQLRRKQMQSSLIYFINKHYGAWAGWLLQFILMLNKKNLSLGLLE